jgi:hypothetical protein
MDLYVALHPHNSGVNATGYLRLDDGKSEPERYNEYRFSASISQATGIKAAIESEITVSNYSN